MSNQLTEEIRRLPRVLSRSQIVAFDAPVKFYEGEIEVQQGNDIKHLQGALFFRWQPETSLRFQLRQDSFALQLGELTLRIPSISFEATGFASSMSDAEMSGWINGAPRAGNTLPCDEVQFDLANFHSYSGTPVQTGDPNRPGMRLARMALSSTRWEVIIDELADYSKRASDKEERYILSHWGLLKSANGIRLSVTDADEALSALHFFLSFMRGSWCTPLFPKGNGAGKVQWETLASWKITSAKDVGTWFPKNQASEAGSAWAGFVDLWNDPNWQYPLRIAIHWYIEANLNSGALEGAIVLAQTALEMLSWTVLVENNQHVTKSKFKKLPTTDKLQDLLSHLQIPTAIPSKLAQLKLLAQQEGKSTGPEILVWIRNSIVHATKKDRDAIQQTSPHARWEALQFARWCLELVLLRLCNYKGVYSNRLTAEWVGEVEKVPWAI